MEDVSVRFGRGVLCACCVRVSVWVCTCRKEARNSARFLSRYDRRNVLLEGQGW